LVSVFYDLQYKSHPEYARWFDRPFWDVLLPASARRSKRIVTLSDAAKADIEHFYPWATGHIDVIPHGIEKEFQEIAARRLSSSLRSNTILTVSTLHPHKNLGTLMRAFLRFSAPRPEYRLVVCGLKGFETERLLRLRTELSLEDRVDFTGWIPRADLYAHFETADAFVYPSRFEGFGIPVLEALTAGIPLACSDIAPLREIADESARYFDPGDESAIVAALEDVTQDDALRERMTRSGRSRAAHFSWKVSAQNLVAIFERVAGTHG
jgi:glycosyltransferase involved in cell wall biosynthesis